MKGKGKFSGDAVKKIFVDHGEKIGLSFAGVLTLLFFLNALYASRLPDNLEPEDIAKAAKDAENRISVAEPDPIPPARSLGGEDNDVTPLEFKPFVRPLAALSDKRQEPEFYPPEKLHVVSGRAPIKLSVSGEKNKEVTGIYVNVITGLIPWERQKKEYQSRFEEALQPEGRGSDVKDEPEYELFVVERAVVGIAGTPVDQLKWVPIPLSGASDADRAKMIQDWYSEDYAKWSVAGMGNRVIPSTETTSGDRSKSENENPETYISLDSAAQKNTPLALNVLKSWFVTQTNSDFAAWPNQKWWDGTWEESDAFNENNLGIVWQATKETIRTGNATGRGEDLDLTKSDIGPKLPELAIGEWSPELAYHPMVVSFLETQDMDEDDARRSKNDASEKLPMEGYKMFRYVDFDVRPGQQFRYRVRLVLLNPNRGLSAKYIANIESGGQQYRRTAPSEPSNLVRVQPDLRMFGGAGKTAKINRGLAPQKAKKHFESSIDVWVAQWDSSQGVLAVKKFPVYASGYVNLDADVKVVNPQNGNVEDLKAFPFQTDHLVVDIHGGTPLRPTPKGKNPDLVFTEPGEVLLMDENGNLKFHNEIDDRQTLNSFKYRYLSRDDWREDDGPVGDLDNPKKGGDEDDDDNVLDDEDVRRARGQKQPKGKNDSEDALRERARKRNRNR